MPQPGAERQQPRRGTCPAEGAPAYLRSSGRGLRRWGAPSSRFSLWRPQMCWTRQKERPGKSQPGRVESCKLRSHSQLRELGMLLGISEHQGLPLLHQARIKVRISSLVSGRGSSTMLSNGSCSARAPVGGGGVEPKENGALAAEGRARAGLWIGSSPALLPPTGSVPVLHLPVLLNPSHSFKLHHNALLLQEVFQGLGSTLICTFQYSLGYAAVP